MVSHDPFDDDLPEVHPAAVAKKITDGLDALIDMVSYADRDGLGRLWAVHENLADYMAVLKADLATQSAMLPYDENGLAETPSGGIERKWSADRTYWDWDLAGSAFAGYVARKYDLPEDLAEQIVADMTATIGGTKSKAWKKTELESREIFSDMMRTQQGGKYRTRFIPRKDPEENEDG